MNNEQIIQEATKAVGKNFNAGYCVEELLRIIVEELLRIIKEQKSEIISRTEEYNDMLEQRNKVEEALEVMTMDVNSLTSERDALNEMVAEQKAEIERLQCSAIRNGKQIGSLIHHLETAKSEAYREFADKITEVFMRYAHIHQYAEEARRDYIEAVDGTNIEMQSVWDVCTLEKNGMAEYEEMGRLQNNIEMISKERLLTELEKDFQLLVNELTRNLHGTCTEK